MSLTKTIQALIILLSTINFSYSADIKKQQIKMFVCPMHHHIQRDHAGKCPICGMALVLNKTATEKYSVITLSNTIKETINVLTENVRHVSLQKEIYAGAKLEPVGSPINTSKNTNNNANNTEISIGLLKPNLKWLKQGSLVEAEAKDFLWGEHTWTGEIISISKQPDSKTHLYTTHINLHTPYGILKPNMYLTLTLYSDAKSALVIPFKSVLFHADGSTYVVRVVGKNQYRISPVAIGIRQDHLVEIIDGLNKHDKVVTDGQFLIRAEKQLRNASHD